ncbi:hypothetical protein [Clostridium oryzae]|uniref:Uncharacterized protein n=1 Tax=Clostridium oryzae TaxID=1450648 RepID=A0A1V4IKL7_9CLOT|nr:hypothetical protein [Clostridium oryzae]OPJ60380.1 hypothetical protein CLORY_28320 [Clostridium oryzae]
MSKYKVGDELIIVENPDKEKQVLKEKTALKIEDDIASISWALKIVKVEYDKPNVTLTYRNLYGQEHKVFAVCSDVANFDKEKVLEKALLKAFQSEIIDISVTKNLIKK